KKITLLADGSGGYVLDAFGGLHPWAVSGHALPVSMAGYGYWTGRNIARDVWLAPDSTAGSVHGYVLDAYGGFHPFWSPGASAPDRKLAAEIPLGQRLRHDKRHRRRRRLLRLAQPAREKPEVLGSRQVGAGARCEVEHRQSGRAWSLEHNVVPVEPAENVARHWESIVQLSLDLDRFAA